MTHNVNTYTFTVQRIDFDLETDDPWHETMDMEKAKYSELLQDTYANGVQYDCTGRDEDEAADLLVEVISNRSGWCVHGLAYDIEAVVPCETYP